MTCSKPNKSSYFDGIFHKLVFFVFSFKEFTAVECKVVAVDNLGMLPCDYCVSTRTYSYRKGKFDKLSKCKMQILVHFSQTNLWKTFMNIYAKVRFEPCMNLRLHFSFSANKQFRCVFYCLLLCTFCSSSFTEEYVTKRRCGISFFPCVKIHVEYDNPSLGQKVDGKCFLKEWFYVSAHLFVHPFLHTALKI